MQAVLAREVELERLEGYLGEAVAGHGQVCFISGEAGSGKTTLLEEFTHRALEGHASLIAVTGTCDAHTGSGDAFLPFREIMEQLTGDLEERTEQAPAKNENAKRLKNVFLVAGETLVEMAPDLIGVVVPGASLLAKAGKYVAGKSKWADRLRKQMEERKTAGIGATTLDKAQVYEQYVNVLERLSGIAPLLLVLDDLQWADTASLGLLFRLARRIEKLPIMVVGNYRPNDIAIGRDGQRHPLEAMLSEVKRYMGDVVIDLDDARKANGRAFIDAYLDEEDNRFDDDFRESLVGHTGGHPLFTIELLRDLQERGDLVKDEGGAWVVGDHLSWDDLPSRVEGVIEERVARLDASSLHSLRVASVEGPQFTAEIVAKVQPTDVRDLIRLLSETLQRQHRIVTAAGLRRIGGQRVSNYRFAHHLMQSYLYRQLDEAEASYLHEDVGLALEALFGAESDQIAVQLARHFDLAGLPEKAVPYLRRAGEQAAARFANDQAFTHYRRALELMPAEDTEGRYGALLAITVMHDKQGESQKRLDDILALTEVAQRSGDTLKLATAHYQRAYYEVVSSNQDAAIEYATLAAEAAAPLDDDQGLEGRARTVLGRALMIKTEHEAAKDELQKGLVLSRMAGSAVGEGLALTYLGIMADVTGHASSARAYFEQALAVHTAAGNRNAIAAAHLNLAVSLWRAGDLAGARDLLERSLSAAQEQGDRSTEGTATGNLAMVLIDLGDLEGGRRMAEVAVELNREHNGPYAVARTLGILANVLKNQFEFTAARAAEQEALELDVAVDDKQDQVYRLAALGSLAATFGQYDEAERLLTQGLELSRAIDEKNSECSTLGSLARLRLRQGDARGALELARGAVDLATEIGYPNDKASYRLVEGDAYLALGSLDAAVEAYEAARVGAEGKYDIDAVAGLADVALARGASGPALELVRPVLDTALAGDIAKIADPLRAYITFHSVLRAVHDARAHRMLEAARGLLNEVIEKIDDPVALESFKARSDVAALLG